MIENKLSNPIRIALFSITLCTVPFQSACVPFIKWVSSSRQQAKSPAPFPAAPNQSAQPANQPPRPVYASQFDLKSEGGLVEKQVYDLLIAKKFEAIEKIASKATANKERLKGGYWKIDSVYDAFAGMYIQSQNRVQITDEMWLDRIGLLREWKDQMPGSITPRIALAEVYAEYGWFARGSGYTKTVSDDGWKKFGERMELAQKELAEVDGMDEKCPVFYREVLRLALTTGWPDAAFEKVYHEAASYEPNYTKIYLSKSTYLLPKWHGVIGDWQKYIDSLPHELAGLNSDDADIIYFIVIADIADESTLHANWTTMSLDRAKKGYADLEKKYGADNYRLNQYANVMYRFVDFEDANAAFDRIGVNRDPEVFSEEYFLAAKNNARKQVGNQTATTKKPVPGEKVDFK